MLRTLLLALASGTTLCAPAHASTVVIWPVDPVIAADKPATALWLENRGTDEVVLQVRCLGWNQRSGEDNLSQQDAVVISPPLARVKPGQRQMVRLIRRGPPAMTGETAMRVLVDELPTPPAPGEAPGLRARLAVQMRYSVPLFAIGRDGPAARPPELTFRVVGTGELRMLEITNGGDRHARLTDLRAGSTVAGNMLRSGLAGYVLGRSTVRWPVSANVPLREISAGVNGVRMAIPAAI